jgi:hypothetical protein
MRLRGGARLVAALLPLGTVPLLVTGLSARQGTQSETTKPLESKPTAQAAAPAQPVPFSHKTHAAFQLPCQFCHPNPDPGNQMTIPGTAKCMGCHAEIAKDKPVIKKLTEFATKAEAIPWVRLYTVPAFVYWSHRTHLEAKMTCEMCHGRVAQMDVLTKATSVTTMGGCVDCHKHNSAGTGCVICHEGLTSYAPLPGVSFQCGIDRCQVTSSVVATQSWNIPSTYLRRGHSDADLAIISIDGEKTKRFTALATRCDSRVHDRAADLPAPCIPTVPIPTRHVIKENGAHELEICARRIFGRRGKTYRS